MGDTCEYGRKNIIVSGHYAACCKIKTLNFRILLKANDFTVARHVKVKEAVFYNSIFYYPEILFFSRKLTFVWPLYSSF